MFDSTLQILTLLKTNKHKKTLCIICNDVEYSSSVSKLAQAVKAPPFSSSYTQKEEELL